jgi:hypothetical protein
MTPSTVDSSDACRELTASSLYAMLDNNKMAMMGKVPYLVIRDAVFAHPTLAESLNNLVTNIDE